tara:strand:- start:760 stop:1335 length:576 start_codon:yes stop_codon:yes gene_type:complete
VYNESMYGVDDLYRIKDLSHSMDHKHWVGKEHLAKKFYELYNHDAGKLLVLGGWYGMMAYQLRKQWPDSQMNIESTDMDPMCEEFGYELFDDKDIAFSTLNISDSFIITQYTGIVNTSCEHMEQKDICSIIKRKDKDCWVAFQSNNYTDLDSHINCYPSAELFAESLELDWYADIDTLDLGDFQRYTVIGK